MDARLNVQSIFESFDGEENGFKGAGQLTTFIRLKGCNLNCAFCDTLYAQNSKPENWMTIAEIIAAIGDAKKVTVTGGEPMLQSENLGFLLARLLDYKIDISIETNGSQDINPWMDGCIYNYAWRHENLRWIVDYKLPSSKMESMMKTDCLLRKVDVIKFVISDEIDYNRALEVIRMHSDWVAQKVFSPGIKIEDPTSYTLGLSRVVEIPARIDNEWPRQLAEMMIRDRLQDIQLSIQIHKVLWPNPDQER